MGQKGAKLTQTTTEFSDHIVEQLESLGQVSSRKMFGGVGIFENGTMFALIDSAGILFFKINEQNRAQFDAAGAKQHGRMPYAEVPASVLADQDQLLDWAQESITIAHQTKKKKK